MSSPNQAARSLCCTALDYPGPRQVPGWPSMETLNTNTKRECKFIYIGKHLGSRIIIEWALSNILTYKSYYILQLHHLPFSFLIKIIKIIEFISLLIIRMFIHLLQRNIEEFFFQFFSIKISDSGSFDLKTSNINFNIKIKIGKTFPFFFFIRNEILGMETSYGGIVFCDVMPWFCNSFLII